MNRVEEKRLELKRRAMLVLFIHMVFSVFVILWMIQYMIDTRMDVGLMEAFGFVLMLFALAAAAWGSYEFFLRKPKKEFKNIFVEEYAVDEFKRNFKDLVYSDRGLDLREVLDNDLIEAGHKYHSYNSFKGVYKDISFEKATLHIEKRTQSAGDDNSMKNLYLGRYIVVDIDLDISNEVYIVNSKLKAGVPDKSMFKESKYTQVKTSHEVFDKKYKIYTIDKKDAVPILSESFINALANYEATEGFGIYFNKDECEIALQSGGYYYDPKVFKPIDDKQENNVRKDIEEIKEILDVIGVIKQ